MEHSHTPVSGCRKKGAGWGEAAIPASGCRKQDAGGLPLPPAPWGYDALGTKMEQSGDEFGAFFEKNGIEGLND